MGNTKRCGGYKGHWECSEEYPNHEVPRSGFGVHAGQKDGLQDKCRKCMNHKNSITNPKANPKAPRHPETNQRRMNWLTARAEEYYGGIPEDRKTDKRWKECRAMATKDSESIAWVTPNDSKSSNVIPFKVKPSKDISLAISIAGVKTIEELYGKSEIEIESYLNIAKSLMSSGRSEVTVKQTSDKRGFVYIITNPAYPGYVKIGKALDVISRFNSYQTYSPMRDYVLEGYEFFPDRREAEDLMKKLLANEQGDAEGEWFKVSVKRAKVALSNIKGVADENAISQG